MNHLIVSIILLFLIILLSFLSFFNANTLSVYVNYSGIQEGYTDANKGSEDITVNQITILNNLLRDIDFKTSTKVINTIRGMKINNPHFDMIMDDRNLSDYEKLHLLKETINYIISNSIVNENNTQNRINQPVISNIDEPVKDEITIEKVILIKNIIDKTDVQNAEISIDVIGKLDLNKSIIKPILERTTLSSYNRILFIKYVIERIVSDMIVNPKEIRQMWKEYVFKPTNTPTDTTSPNQPTDTTSPNPTN